MALVSRPDYLATCWSLAPGASRLEPPAWMPKASGHGRRGTVKGGNIKERPRTKMRQVGERGGGGGEGGEERSGWVIKRGPTPGKQVSRVKGKASACHATRMQPCAPGLPTCKATKAKGFQWVSTTRPTWLPARARPLTSLRVRVAGNTGRGGAGQGSTGQHRAGQSRKGGPQITRGKRHPPTTATRQLGHRLQH